MTSKQIIITTCAICLVVALSVGGYFIFKPCEHQWTDATCKSPKTCSLCGETEGEPAEHMWIDADCENPVTCEFCLLTAGKPLGHQWQEANCKVPKTCSVCKKTEGEISEHKWSDATCTQPKTCSVCKTTEGEALGHTWKAATYSKPKTCSVCGETTGTALSNPNNSDSGGSTNTDDTVRCPICDSAASRKQTSYCSSHDCSQTDCPYPAKYNGAGAWGSYCEFHGCQTPKCLNIPIGGTNYCASCR